MFCRKRPFPPQVSRRQAVDVGDDGVNLRIGEFELRHLIVRARNAARKRLTQRQDRVTACHVDPARRAGIGAFASVADGVAPGTVLLRQLFAVVDQRIAARRRIGVVAQPLQPLGGAGERRIK